MPWIIINYKYTGAILSSTHMFAYTHIYTRKHTCAHDIHPYIHTFGITETMAMIHTVQVNRLFPKSITQQDTNWKGEKTHKRERGTNVQVRFFHPRRSCWCDIFHYRRAPGGRIDQGRGEHAALHSYRFHVGDCGDVKGPRWYKRHSQAIPRTSGVRLQRWEACHML